MSYGDVCFQLSSQFLFVFVPALYRGNLNGNLIKLIIAEE